MAGQVLPHRRRLPDPSGYPGAQQGNCRRAEGHAEEGEGQVLYEEAAGHLAGGEADGLEDRDVPQLAADAGADRPGGGERGREQRAESEYGEHLPEQPVVAPGLGPGLLPLGDLGDAVGAEDGHGPLDGEVGVVRILQAQAHALPGVAAGDLVEGVVEDPADAGRAARVVAGLGDLGDPADPQGVRGSVRAGDPYGVARLGPQSPRDRGLQYERTVAGRPRRYRCPCCRAGRARCRR